jgi:hypothetical protein
VSARRSPLAAPVTDCLVVGLVATGVYALHGYDARLVRDVGAFMYGGERFAAGVPPYAGIFNTVGPLADAVPGLAIWVGRHLGIEPVSAARHFFTLISAACCVLVYLLGRQVLGSRAAGFVAAAVFLTFGEFLRLASGGPREKTTMVLFLLAALLLLGRRWWLAAGVATALATLTWQPSLAVAVTAAVISLAGAPSGRVRGAISYVAGGAVPTALTALYYLLHGDLRLAVDGFVVVNARYKQQPSLLSAPRSTWHFLWVGYEWSLWLVVAGLVGLVVTAVAIRPRPVPLLALGAAAAVGTAWSVAVINGAPDLFVLLPFGALGVAAVVVRAAALLPRCRLALVASVAALAVVAAGAEAVDSRNDALVGQRTNVAAVLAAAPDATLLSINAPQVMALAGRANPTRYQLFDQGIDDYLQHTLPHGLAGYTHWIGRHRPTLIARSGAVGETWPDEMLARYYWYVGRGPDWVWYLSRTAGPEVLHAVRLANRQTRRP